MKCWHHETEENLGFGEEAIIYIPVHKPSRIEQVEHNWYEFSNKPLGKFTSVALIGLKKQANN